jgi:hypothetical protein
METSTKTCGTSRSFYLVNLGSKVIEMTLTHRPGNFSWLKVGHWVSYTVEGSQGLKGFLSYRAKRNRSVVISSGSIPRLLRTIINSCSRLLNRATSKHPLVGCAGFQILSHNGTLSSLSQDNQLYLIYWYRRLSEDGVDLSPESLVPALGCTLRSMTPGSEIYKEQPRTGNSDAKQSVISNK